jgi:hypothetical protein
MQEEQEGYEIERNILCQDNKSTILLERNGKKSSSERTCAIKICYFFLMDPIQKGNLVVEYRPTTDMVADDFSKPLQGKLFQKFCKAKMGHYVSSLHSKKTGVCWSILHTKYELMN